MRRRYQACVRAAAVCAVAALTAPALAQYQVPDPTYAAPGSYYNAATSTVGPTLKQQLNDIIDGHTQHSYDAAKTIIPVLDADPNNPSNVLLVYSGYSVQGEWSTGGTIWNREHVWPNSYGIIDAGIDYSDLFNLRPSNPNVNSDRNNEYFDNVDPAFRMIGHALAPETYEDNRIPDVSQDQMWEPRPVEKGDLARGLFYMDVRYDGADAGTTDLTLVENVAIIATNSPYMGRLSSLLKWHYQDGISNAERRRNDLIHDLYQGNRNPFVDHPEWVWAVFGGGSNNSRLYVGGVNPPTGASSADVNLRIIKGAASWGSANVTLNKSGVHPTTYDVISSGSATTVAAGTGQSFDYNSQSRAIAVSLSGSTGIVGTISGTVTIDNTDITSGGGGLGSADGNDTINLTGTVLEHAQPSFVDGATGTAQMIDFGYVPAGGAQRSAVFDVWNNAATADLALTASLDVDGVSKSGSALMGTSVTPSNPAAPLAAGQSRGYLAHFTPAASDGLDSATHTIATSDENLPGAIARANLVLSTTGRTTSGVFPVSGDLFLLPGEHFVTTSFEIADGAAVHKQGAGTMSVQGLHAHGATAHLVADGGAVDFFTDAGATATSGLKVTVGSAPVTFHSDQHLRSLEVLGTASVAADGGLALAVGELLIAPGASIDLKDNDLIVYNGHAGVADGSGVYSGIQGDVQGGMSEGTWDGAGIITSMPDALSGLTGIGVGAAADVLNLAAGQTGAWNGQAVSAEDVLAMYTYVGDANLDGFISGDDYSAIDFASTIAGADGWVNGDFNYDGVISGDDYSAIDFNLVAQGAPLGGAGTGFGGAVVAVPEPAACLVAALAAPLLLARRRRAR